MKKFHITKIDYTNNCYGCHDPIPYGSDRIRRAVREMVGDTLAKKAKDQDFHVDCNTEFEEWYAPARDAIDLLKK